MDLVREPRLLQRPRQIGHLGGRERVEILLARLRRRLIGGGRRLRAPVGAEEDGGGGDVEDDDGVSGADVVIDGPADGEGAFLGEVHCDADFTAGAGGGGGGGGGGSGGGVVVVVVGVARGGWVVDLDGGEVRVIGRIWVHVSSLSLASNFDDYRNFVDYYYMKIMKNILTYNFFYALFIANGLDTG